MELVKDNKGLASATKQSPIQYQDLKEKLCKKSKLCKAEQHNLCDSLSQAQKNYFLKKFTKQQN